jgi:hypothetical protein
VSLTWHPSNWLSSPNGLSFFVDLEHPELRVENLSDEKEKKFFGDASGVLGLLAAEFNLKMVKFFLAVF